MLSTLYFSKDQKFIVVGRDLRNLANLQQRLVEAQQAIETDYLDSVFGKQGIANVIRPKLNCPLNH
jgi:hypothetical protein